MKKAEQKEWPGTFGNWGRWDNDRGTLNLLTKDVVLRAALEIRVGQVFPLGRLLQEDELAKSLPAELGELAERMAYQHQITLLDPSQPNYPFQGEKLSGASDVIRIAVHGMSNTHIDALCHSGHHGNGFNGRPFGDMVNEHEKAKIGAVTELGAIVTRGVLVDVPRLRGLTFLRPGDPVLVEDLRKGTADLLPGDALIVRTGRSLAPPVLPGSPGASGDFHGNWSGLHVDSMHFIAEKDVAVLVTDGPGDNFPSTTSDSSSPIHVLSQVYLGLPLVHSIEVEHLAEACHNSRRNTFFFMVAPLQIKGGTGSPVSPVAIL